MKKPRFYWEKDNGSKGIEIDVPGFDKDEIHVKLTSNSLTISATKKGGKEVRGKGFYRAESFASSFSKSIALPGKIKPPDFEVEIKNGRVVLKKKKKVRTDA